MFSINMLTHTETGGTFSFAALAADLQAAGFTEPELRVVDRAMKLGRRGGATRLTSRHRVD